MPGTVFLGSWWEIRDALSLVVTVQVWLVRGGKGGRFFCGWWFMGKRELTVLEEVAR